VALAAVLVGTLATVSTPAQADRHRPMPTRTQVQHAQRQVATSRLSVRQIQQQVAAANDRLNRLNIAALQAVQRYNGAVARYQDAKRLAISAQRKADMFRRQAEQARRVLAQVAIDQTMSGTDGTLLGTAMQAGGQRQLLETASNDHSALQVLDSARQQVQARSRLAAVYQKQADDALVEADRARTAAAGAKRDARRAVGVERRAVGQIAAQRTQLLRSLARAEHMSVALATQRQQGLERLRQLRLQRERKARFLAEQRRRARQQRQQQHQGAAHHPRHHQTPSPAPTPTPAPSPPPPPPPGPSGTSGQGAQAVRFAYAQLGEPYVWGGAGPNVWDCSGLTMMAWLSAGVPLAHYAPTQYLETTPISYSQIRPGDLIYWASDPGNPATIFHAAMYIGGGQMIQAPRPGRNVEIQNVFYWEAPAFFGRP
jgi:cell wall-associated NlpC family hydrolase